MDEVVLNIKVEAIAYGMSLYILFYKIVVSLLFKMLLKDFREYNDVLTSQLDKQGI